MISSDSILKAMDNGGRLVNVPEEVNLFNGWDKIDREYYLSHNKEGNPLSTLGNAKSILLMDDEMFGRFFYDPFSLRYMVKGPLFKENRGEYIEELNDSHYSRMQMWFVSKGLVSIRSADVAEACMYACRQCEINPLHEYFHRLEWDGVDRMKYLMSEGFGADDTPYAEIVSRVLILSIAARVIYPGCKVDTMVILEGKQGIGKSSGCMALMKSQDWFNDQLGDPTDKDTLENLFGTLLVEHAELAGQNKRDRNQVKSFITRQKDRFRRAYARAAENVKRRTVFIGTTNENVYLTDPTGDRRYVPIEVKKIDVPWIVRNRDQIWAEAMQKIRDGEEWWMTKEEEELANEQRASRISRDAWEEAALSYCSDKEFVTSEEVLRYIKPDISMHNNMDKSRVRGILQLNGWEYRQIRSGDDRGKRGFFKGDN